MSDETRPGDPPPDLPPEYAEAYRRAYERAYRETAAGPETVAFTPVEDDEQQEAERFALTGPLFADEIAQHSPQHDVEPTRMLGGHVPAPVEEPQEPRIPWESPHDTTRHQPADRPAWLVPALLAAAVVVLLGAAYGIGKAFSDSVSSGASGQQTPGGVVINEDGSTAHPKTHKPVGDAYSGSVQSVAIGGVSASCQAPDSVDAAGHPVSYRPKNVYDGDFTTAWRCNGNGVGQKLTLQLPASTEIAEVGLVPGYAKTDPRSGADRYAQNNRITKVRWVFSDGTAVEQSLDGSPSNRDLQTMRIPPTKADSVVVEILSTTAGPRNTTAVSEVRLGRPA